MSHFYFLRRKNFKLEKIIFLPKKYIYFITYCNEHPVLSLFYKRGDKKRSIASGNT